MASQDSNLSNLAPVAFGEDSISNTTSNLPSSHATISDIDSLTPSTTSKASIPNRTSDVWAYCLYPQSQVVRNTIGDIVWTCRVCRKAYKLSGGTTTLRRHLKSAHQIDVSSSNATRINSYQQGIDESFARARESGQQYKRRRLDSGLEEILLDPTVLEDLYIKWITADKVPFDMVRSDEFRAYVFLLYLVLVSLNLLCLDFSDILIAKSTPFFLLLVTLFDSG
jgi:hypothetical protein